MASEINNIKYIIMIISDISGRIPAVLAIPFTDITGSILNLIPQNILIQYS